MNNIRTYIKQRIHFGLLTGLSVWLVLYSMEQFSIDLPVIGSVVLLFCFLLVLRLYDDLMQVNHDSGKPDRDYTQPPVRKSLSYTVAVALVCLAGIAFLIDLQLGVAAAIFFLLNHLLYVLFVRYRVGAALLPLLKYPFLFFLSSYVLTSGFDLSRNLLCEALGLFIAFVAFESMEDPGFPLPKRSSYFAQVLPFALLETEHPTVINLLPGILLLALSLVSNYRRWKFAPYLFLLLLLTYKLVLHVNLIPE